MVASKYSGLRSSLSKTDNGSIEPCSIISDTRMYRTRCASFSGFIGSMRAPVLRDKTNCNGPPSVAWFHSFRRTHNDEIGMGTRTLRYGCMDHSTGSGSEYGSEYV